MSGLSKNVSLAQRKIRHPAAFWVILPSKRFHPPSVTRHPPLVTLHPIPPGILYLVAAWTQLKRPLLTPQPSSSFVTVHSVLFLQKYTTADPITKGSYNFAQERVSIPFTHENDTCYQTVIQSLERTGKVIKCNKFGFVSLGKMENCACDCWIRIKPASSGK